MRQLFFINLKDAYQSINYQASYVAAETMTEAYMKVRTFLNEETAKAPVTQINQYNRTGTMLFLC